jgi:hypothetical protein
MGSSWLPLRRGISLTVIACLGVFGSVTSVSAQPSAPSQPAPSLSDVIASGVLTNAHGDADPNGEVYVLALPDQSDMIGRPAGVQFSLTLAGFARTNAQGNYLVTVSPASLMTTNGRHGYLNLQVIAVSEGMVMQFAYSVAHAGKAWRVEGGANSTPSTSFDFSKRTVTGTPVAATVAPGSSAAPTGMAMKPAAGTADASPGVASATSITPATPTPALQQLRQSTQFATTAGTIPKPGFCWFYWSTEYYGIREHFLNAETWGGNIPETITEGTNSSTTATLGIGYSWSGASGTWGASGTASITDSSTYGVSSTFSTSYSVYNRVNYRDLRGTCGGVYREPYSFYDLLTADGGPVAITWQYYCGPHSAGSNWYSGSATDATVGGGVNLGVLNVSAQQGYGTSVQLKYHFNVAGQVCGNSSGGPLQSSLLEADPY